MDTGKRSLKFMKTVTGVKTNEGGDEDGGGYVAAEGWFCKDKYGVAKIISNCVSEWQGEITRW